jgi:phosphatidylglycerol:prolipoprotein diacylglycerol transferase
MIQIGPIRIAWYGFFLVIAIFIGFEIARRLLERWGYDPDMFERVAFWAVIWGVVGARLVYVVTSPRVFLQDPIQALYIWHGGLSIHGAILGGLVAIWYFHRRYGTPTLPYLDAVVPGIAIGIIAGRLGNIMNGADTSGRLTHLFGPSGFFPLTITWPVWATGYPGLCVPLQHLAYSPCPGPVVRGPVWFTELFGALIGVVLLILAYRWLRQERAFGYVFWNLVLWYSILRSVFEETFRLNPLWVKVYDNTYLGIGFLTATQLVSIILIPLALIMLRRLPQGRRAPAVARAPQKGKRG